MTRGVQTLYRGVEYRSRLEARWAAFMDRIGWETTYEPLDGNGYIPDFLVHGPSPFLVEVKPAATPGDYQDPVGKVSRGLRGLWTGDVLVVGMSPLAPGMGNAEGGYRQVAGWLGEANDADWAWDAGMWFTCRRCGGHGVFHDVMSFDGRPCGCYDGDGHLGILEAETIRAHWVDACNQVKWRGRTA